MTQDQCYQMDLTQNHSFYHYYLQCDKIYLVIEKCKLFYKSNSNAIMITHIKMYFNYDYDYNLYKYFVCEFFW